MLVVLALDALDFEHVEEFETDTLKLKQRKEIETFSYMNDQPYTLEVWPTVATGLSPQEHGVTGGGTSEWDNPLLQALSTVTAKLGGNTRDKLGNLAESVIGASYSIPETDKNHIFQGEGRIVHNWPGVHNSAQLQRVWELGDPEKSGGRVSEFERAVCGIGAEQFGWVREMLNHNATLVGCHIHTLDICGHIFRSDKEKYQEIYEWVDDRVSEILDELDEDDDILLLSDHGIHTVWDSSNIEPSRHSERAMAATTLSKDLFDDVRNVRGWIEEAIDEPNSDRSTATLDVPTEQLEDLGYL